LQGAASKFAEEAIPIVLPSARTEASRRGGARKLFVLDAKKKERFLAPLGMTEEFFRGMFSR
jgi:hypothetical protein